MQRTSEYKSAMSDKRRKSGPGPSKHDIDFILNNPQSSSAHASSRHSGVVRGSSASNRRSHNRPEVSKRKSKDRPYECDICGFSFGQRSDRNKHIRTVHLGERPFTCTYCNQTFGEKGNL